MAIVHWTNGNGGDWNTDTNWDTQQAPGSNDDVFIDAAGSYTVTVSSPGSANSLTIASGETVEIQSALTVVNGLSNAGTVQIDDATTLSLGGSVTNSVTGITLNSTGDATDLVIAGTVTLQGSGNVTLFDAGTFNRNRIFSNTGGSVLDNVDNTIAGAGEIYSNNDLSLTNEAAGVIDATGTTALEIDHITVTNNGLLEATNTGGLEIVTATVNNSGNGNGGHIEAVGSGDNVYLDGADIVGGSLSTAIGGLIETSGNGGQLDGSTASAPVVITTGSTVQVTNATGLSLLGTITNNGTLSLAATANGTTTDLLASGTVTLQGGGSVTLSDAGMLNRNRIDSNTSGSVLDNIDNTISGAGEIFSNGGNLSLTNEAAGVIDATGTTALEIDHITVTNKHR
jgi:hypothetical protein